MEITATARFVKVSPRKVRLVAQSIKSKSPTQALEVLRLTKKSGSLSLQKVLSSAIANATNNLKLAKENLHIKRIEVGEAGAFKRFHPVARGRTHPYKKRMSHIQIVLEAKNESES